jgi:hypothetical protein
MDADRVTAPTKVFAAFLYGSVSFLIVIINKNLLTGHRYAGLSSVISLYILLFGRSSDIIISI